MSTFASYGQIYGTVMTFPLVSGALYAVPPEEAESYPTAIGLLCNGL